MTRTAGWKAAVLGLALGSLGLGLACGGGDGNGDDPTDTPGPTAVADATATVVDDLAAIEDVVRRQADANNSRDIDAFLASFADRFFSDELGVTREQAREIVAGFIGEPQVEIVDITGTTVSGDEATAVVRANEGVVLSLERYSLARQDGSWLITAIEELPVELPEGVTTVDLQMVEYRFEFDGAAVAGGDFAFDVTNAGAQRHEIDLKRVPSDLEVERLTDPAAAPAGVETVGLFGPLDPGSEGALVLAEPLSPGRYVMLCFIPDASGTAHAALGMWAEFVVE